MAVYDRTYRGYTGELTAERGRFLILTRYAFGDVFRSRFFTSFYFSCFLGPLALAFIIYLHHNLSALSLMQLSSAALVNVDASFFGNWFMRTQGILSFFVTFLVGPALVSPDLRNNALPLYLSRPFSRTEYVLGKMSVLVILLSAITWIPGLLLFGLQSYLEGFGWLGHNMRIAAGLFFGAWIWILVLSLLALAVSASVKWRPLASAALFGIFFVASAMGAVLNLTLHTTWASFIDISLMVNTVWASLFGVAPPIAFPAAGAWLSLLLICAISLLLLNRKLKAYEVVR